VIARAEGIGDELRIVDLSDEERALVWIDGRFAAVLVPGLHALWTAFRDVRVEVIELDGARFDHAKLDAILQAPGADVALQRVTVEPGWAGVWLENGEVKGMLKAGTFAFWRKTARVEVRHVDVRETAIEVSGQEIMTADKVTLRLNAVVAFAVKDPVAAVTGSEDFRQALYTAAQLALRAVVGTKPLDTLLGEKDVVAAELEAAVKRRATDFGVEVTALGIKDVILPGDMKELMNKVTEAKKTAEAQLLTRREETAAMRSQANTARLLEANPTLMRMRELEVLEKVADKANLTVILGENGLADRVVKLL
jgi:hypothetical protein